jgi:hypothetical protein
MSTTRKDDPTVAVLRGVRGACDGPIARIEIRHLHADGEARVGGLVGDEISGKGVTPDGITEKVLEIIDEDARSFRGVSRYAVLFYRPDEREYCKRTLVRVKKSDDELSNTIEETESPTDRGVTMQSMRHLETRSNELTARERLVAQQTEHLITRLSGMVTQLADVFPRVLEAEQTLLDRSDERRIRLRREEKQDKVVERGIEQIMMLAGPLMGKMLPGKAGQAMAQDMMLLSLMSSLKPEQIQALMGTLTPEQQANFIELYKSLRERYDKVKLTEGTPQDSAGTTHEPEAPSSNGATSS